MRRRITAVMGAAAMVLMASSASAQSASFAGKWVVDAEKTAAANPAPQGGQGGGRMGGGMMGGGAVTIETGKLSVERPGRGDAAPTTVVYKLDGSEQAVAMGPMQAKAKARIDGETIVVETTREGQNGVTTTKQVWSVEGDWLVSTQTNPGRDGTPMTRKTYYKKG